MLLTLRIRLPLFDRTPGPLSPTEDSLSQLHHHIWNLYVLSTLIVGRDFENDIPLVFRDGLLADGLDEFVESGRS